MKTLARILAMLVGFAGLGITLYVSPLGEGLLTPVQESVGPRGAQMRVYGVSGSGASMKVRVELRDSTGWLRAITNPWNRAETVEFRSLAFEWTEQVASYAPGRGFDLVRLRRKQSAGVL